MGQRLFRGNKPSQTQRTGNEQQQQPKKEYQSNGSVTPYVFKRKGSMYFNEEGDLAHEFYVETRKSKGKGTYMKRILDHLTPQGDVDLKLPRLHVDFCAIMCEVRKR